MSETEYTFVTVPKISSNAGRPTGKRSYLIFFKWDDVKTFTKDDKGVNVTAFALNTAKTPVGVFATDSTINIYHSLEGDNEARGYIQKVDFEHPGTDQEFDEFANNNANEKLGVIVVSCDPSVTVCKIAGTPCTPLYFSKNDSEDSGTNNKSTVNLASALRGSTIGRIAKTLIPVTDNTEVNTILGLAAPTGV